MHHLIASYLFQHKTCPLPGLGTLSIVPGNAETDFLNKKINAPVAVIHFSQTENNADELVKYIAAKTNSDTYEASEAVEHFCDAVNKSLSGNAAATLDGVGQFFVDSSGNLQFQANDLPKVFLQHVKAVRVIHPDAEHQILVGDRETTNTLMTEYFSEDIPVKKNRWWIWAIVLGAVALVTLLIYLSDEKKLGAFGNAIKL